MLYYHSNPKLSILEVQTSSSPNLLNSEHETLRRMLKTCTLMVASPFSCHTQDTDEFGTSSETSVRRKAFKVDEDLERQDFKNQRFDIIICFDLLNGVEQPEMAIANMRRLLQPEGATCFVEIDDPVHSKPRYFTYINTEQCVTN